MAYTIPTVEEINKKYDEYLDSSNETAPQEVIQAYRAIFSALDDYINALTEFEWKCGYKYAKGAQ